MVMKCIWSMQAENGGGVTMQQVAHMMAEQHHKEWKIQTVSTFLNRLYVKGFLSTERHGRAYYYTPIISETDFRRQKMEEYVQFWDNGDSVAFFKHALKVMPLNDSEREQIKGML